MHLSQQISLARKEKGFTQEQLAEQSGLTVRTIQRIESGETQPRAFTVKAIAAALDLSFDRLHVQETEKAQVDEAATVHFMQLFVLSCFSYLVIPFVHFLLPVHLLKRCQAQLPPEALSFARKLVRLQISWLITMNLVFLLVLAWNLALAKKHPQLAVSYLVPFFFFYGLNAVILVVHVSRIRRNRG